MALIESLIEFFGIDLIGEASTFPDLINTVLQIGCGIWITLFVCRCLFMATTFADRKFY